MNALLLVTFSLFGQTSLDDGTLIFLENCNYFVERYTSAPVGHVAIAVNESDKTWIYEATPGRVRRLTWEAYRLELGKLNEDRRRKQDEPIVTWVYAPKEQLSETQRTGLQKLLESQVGRRYSVRGIVRGQPSDGIHCAELASLCLTMTDRAEIREAHRKSPAQVMEIAQAISQRPYQATIAPPTPEETWCARTWRKCTHWAVMCRWSWSEAVRFCW